MARRILFLFTVALLAGLSADETPGNVLHATLDNGLRVVIVRDPLAPVATFEENYLVGGQDTPAGFPGTAHAQEHMAFRGCAGLTADQISAIYAQLGGTVNADTQQNITQYFVTVPVARSGSRAAPGCCLHAGCAGFRRAVGGRARRDRAGGLARSLEPDLQIHHAAQRRSVHRHAVCARRAGNASPPSMPPRGRC